MSTSGGTPGGANASGTARTANPIVIAGTSNGGTVDVPNVDQWLAGGSQSSMPASQALVAAAAVVNFDGVGYVPLRTPNVFKSVACNAAGDTALWTPAAGKKFRLMGFLITMSNGVAQAAGAALTMQFRDATTAMGITVSPFVPAAAGTVAGATVWSVPSLGNGVLSAAANNVLNFNLAAAVTASFVQVDAWGTEE